MKLLNRKKLKQLIGNAGIPGVGAGIVFYLAFGFTWWALPATFLFGALTSLVISKPKQLQLLEGKKTLQLSEGKKKDLVTEQHIEDYLNSLENNRY